MIREPPSVPSSGLYDVLNSCSRLGATRGGGACVAGGFEAVEPDDSGAVDGVPALHAPRTMAPAASKAASRYRINVPPTSAAFRISSWTGPQVESARRM